MRRRGDACGCIQRFLIQFSRLGPREMDGLRHEDDVCYVECTSGIIRAYSYEIISGTRYKNGECVMSVW